jgi:hypothetical protein
MSPHAYIEDRLVEQPAIGLFAVLGWQTVLAMEKVLGPDGTLPANSLSTPGPGFSRSAQRTVLSASRLRGFARGDSVSGLSLPRSILTMDHTDFTDANRRIALGCLRCLL